jgi:antitoxin component HigA of HigAB toxin-antitoxin module
MDHQQLNTTDFNNEIGGKSTVSMICNEKGNSPPSTSKSYQSALALVPSYFFKSQNMDEAKLSKE